MPHILGRRRYDVTVAAFGDVSKPFGEGAPWPDEWEKPYRDRPKVTFSVARDTTLGYVLREAMAKLMVQPPPWEDPFPFGLPFVAFYKAEDEVRFSTPFQSSLPLLDELGRVTFNNYNFDEVTFDELVRASHVNAFEGDPLRPYLILHHEVGNGVLADWGTLINLWDLAWHVLTYIDTHLETLLSSAEGCMPLSVVCSIGCAGE